MILELGAGATVMASAAAAVVLATHITGGVVGLAAGGTALVARKGASLHRRAGIWFVGSMLVMSSIGGVVAPLLPQRSSVVPAALTFYLVATGWVTMRRLPGTVGRFESAAFVFAWLATALGVAFAMEAARSPTGRLDGEDPATYLVFAAFAAVGGTLDGFVIARGGVSGADRSARHVWRMCVALLIAATSFFLGQQQIFPAWIRGSPVLFLPEAAIVAVMSFWIVRVRLGQRLAETS